MSQILHIFRKDVRHHWPEILVSLLLLLVYAWREPYRWQQSNTYAFLFFAIFVHGTIRFLLPLAWCFLLLRLVQGEPPVGDRQFWVTRPYEWKKLLAAKAVFALIFVNLPLFFVQMFLLRAAGFRVLPHLLGLLSLQLGLCTSLAIAVFVLAVITRNITQAILVAIAFYIVALAIFPLISMVPSSSMSYLNVVGHAFIGWLALVACFVVILWQYARRRTWQSRGLLLAAGALIVLVEAASPYAALVARKYPLAGAAHPAPARFTLLPAIPPVQKTQFSPYLRAMRHPGAPEVLLLPLSISGIANDSVVVLEGTRIVLDGPGGAHWDSHWNRQWQRLWPGDESTMINFELKDSAFRKLNANPVSIHLSLVMSEYRDSATREYILQDGLFSIPGVGLCNQPAPTLNLIHCRAPLRFPSLMASFTASQSTCTLEQGVQPPSGVMGYFLFWRGNDALADPGLSPISQIDVGFQEVPAPPPPPAAQSSRLRLCPGTPIQIGVPQDRGSSRVEMQIPNVKLEDYIPQEPRSSGAIGIGISP